ncbi:probable G-protein coupled receptor 139 [Scyliorhinus torazame]|uniref:probable G-protein coupled receptor 139 n=1 Tax=Scyliorhinus torazame TaxID=75743 RepID=UPI003B5CB778
MITRDSSIFKTVMGEREMSRQKSKQITISRVPSPQVELGKCLCMASMMSLVLRSGLHSERLPTKSVGSHKSMETFHSIRKIYYMIVAVVGVPVNLVAIVILSQGKCGLSNCTTRYLVAMATADLLAIVTAVILWQIVPYYFPKSFLEITPVCSGIFVLLYAATDCSVWFTVAFSFDRCVAICCPKLKIKYCTEKTAAVVLSVICILFSLKDIPFYFIFEPEEVIDNVPWFCKVTTSYHTDSRWVDFNWLNTVLTPLLPYVLILLLNTLTVRYILVASRVRKALRGQKKIENRSDPEMESRRRSVILLFAISGTFIILWLLYVVNFLHNIITGDGPEYNDSLYILAKVAVMLSDLSCCTNTFIYGVTQSKFRDQFKSAVKYPVTSIIVLINKQN